MTLPRFRHPADFSHYARIGAHEKRNRLIVPGLYFNMCTFFVYNTLIWSPILVSEEQCQFSLLNLRCSCITFWKYLPFCLLPLVTLFLVYKNARCFFCISIYVSRVFLRIFVFFTLFLFVFPCIFIFSCMFFPEKLLKLAQYSMITWF